MIITKKTTLLPAIPETRIRVRMDDPESLTWGLYRLVLAEGREKALVDWGDGTRSEITADGESTHDFARPGEYEVRISDDIESIRFSTRSTGSPFRAVYAPMIREFRTTAPRLHALTSFCFYNAENLSAFRCDGSGVGQLAEGAFGSCPSLVGRLDLPNVDSLAVNTFTNSANISELHFSAAKEAAIRASPEWEASGGRFGATNATVRFDL